MAFYDYLKNFFLILIILQVSPPLIISIKKQYERYLMQKSAVGIIPIKGILYDSSRITKQFHSFFKDDSIKAILIKMDCPGSAAGTGQAIYNELTALKKEYPKPVVVLVENLSASGGYWIATAADHIVASETAIIGSIGAYFPYLFQFKNLIADYKIDYVNIKAGKYKTATDPFTQMTNDERAMLQSVLDDSYEQFTHIVATNRKLSLTSASEWADGKIFTGRQALTLGLIDSVGSLHNAIAIIKDKALIEGDIEWIKPHTQTSIWNYLAGGQQDDDDTSMMSSSLDSVCTYFENRYSSLRT